MLDRFRLQYRLAVQPDGVIVTRGDAPPRFVHGVRDVAKLHGIDRGTIECKGANRHARLIFSYDFPDTGRQAIRNLWSAPTTPGPGGGRRARG